MTDHTANPPELTAEMTVSEIIVQRPKTLGVFHRFGIDACCGGALPLAEVARKHRLDFIALLAELDRA
jgi:regulator of cell morphogenesis and NO signaling